MIPPPVEYPQVSSTNVTSAPKDCQVVSQGPSISRQKTHQRKAATYMGKNLKNTLLVCLFTVPICLLVAGPYIYTRAGQYYGEERAHDPPIFGPSMEYANTTTVPLLHSRMLAWKVL